MLSVLEFRKRYKKTLNRSEIGLLENADDYVVLFKMLRYNVHDIFIYSTGTYKSPVSLRIRHKGI